MTHLVDFLKNRPKVTPNREINAKSGQKSTHGRAGGSFYVDRLGILANPTKSDADFGNSRLWPTFGPLCLTFVRDPPFL